MSDRHIVVAGHTPVDLLVYPSPPLRDREKLNVRKSNGGAALIAGLLEATRKEHEHQIHQPAGTKENILEQILSAITELEICGEEVDSTFGFKVARRQQLQNKAVWHSPPQAQHDNVSVLIFQDAECGYGFSNPHEAVDLFHKSCPQSFVYRMARPLGTGAIWDTVRRGPYGKDGKQDPNKLIVIISADDLRAEGIELSYGLSWEKTCEDFVEKLGSNGKLDTLVSCAHLIVLFGCDGAIYHRGIDLTEPTLFFDPLSTEGRYTRRHLGDLPGLPEAFIGGFTTELAKSPGAGLDECIRRGIGTARGLAKLGFRNSKVHNWPRYPVSEIMKNQLPEESLITLSIPSESISSGSYRHWSILHHNIGDPVQVAHRIVTKGTNSAANWIPISRFGPLKVLDRSEIEAFRAVFNSVYEYLSDSQTRPLNIAIFGSRGSGKSFAAVHVAKAAAEACSQGTTQLRFNLSQFSSVDDLAAAFNAIRDCTLAGTLPLVYINAFDAHFAGVRFGWLPHLLSAMHGGQFLDRSDKQHIGPAIFLLGSSTTTSFQGFQDSCKETESSDSPIAQEFMSCLHAFVNVLGLDQVNASDALYPVRRAVVLRALLEEREPNLRRGEGISIDESVLDGLLMIPTFQHGLRSLKSIIAMSKLTGKRHFERAALPPEKQLSLHLDYDLFTKYAQFDILPEDLREPLAIALHEKYVTIRKGMANTEEEKKGIEKQASLQPWKPLEEQYKESNRAHACDIPRKLRLIECFLAKKDSTRTAVEEFSETELNKLAEIEHERWNAERLQAQWHKGPRNEKERRNPFLIPWRDLPKIWQDVDRAMVKSYPKILPETYKIHRIGKVTKTTLRSVFKAPTV
ncbi:hypothetical protein K469DRAFT_631583 [Zopfia rhizophila CBS 207.26]|uniref:Ryanodine receptor Ryr domain-containing protein n=1 Tax=Zopfia rhizophila CBS 207.26 TaxID=1314779 RepID=A0A6A6E1P4_9PEZI|nr:hypothetical protein K469DRAFT_631583 [Zopfia rhizophila CBS 207.26]